MHEQLAEMIKETTSREVSKKAVKIIEKLVWLKAVQSKYQAFYAIRLRSERVRDQDEMRNFKNAQIAEMDRQRKKHQEALDSLSNESQSRVTRATGRAKSPQSPTFLQSTGRGRGSSFLGQSEYSPDESRFATIQFERQGLDSAPSRTPEPIQRQSRGAKFDTQRVDLNQPSSMQSTLRHDDE